MGPVGKAGQGALAEEIFLLRGSCCASLFLSFRAPQSHAAPTTHNVYGNVWSAYISLGLLRPTITDGPPRSGTRSSCFFLLASFLLFFFFWFLSPPPTPCTTPS
jgi:hypothetical protein